VLRRRRDRQRLVDEDVPRHRFSAASTTSSPNALLTQALDHPGACPRDVMPMPVWFMATSSRPVSVAGAR
jgi:hypothetical protein